jgi:AcrR family transcriptional regulator
MSSINDNSNDTVDLSRTQTSLAWAIIALMPKNAWEDITISMLCKEAGISRTTFYAHFSSKGDLLENLFTWIENAITNIPTKGRGLDVNGTIGFLSPLLGQIKDRKQVIQRQKDNRSGYMLALRFRSMLANMIRIEFQRSQYGDMLDDTQYTLLSGAISALLRRWIDAYYSEPEEEMLNILDKHVSDFLVAQGIKTAGE